MSPPPCRVKFIRAMPRGPVLLGLALPAWGFTGFAQTSTPLNPAKPALLIRVHKGAVRFLGSMMPTGRRFCGGMPPMRLRLIDPTKHSAPPLSVRIHSGARSCISLSSPPAQGLQQHLFRPLQQTVGRISEAHPRSGSRARPEFILPSAARRVGQNLFWRLGYCAIGGACCAGAFGLCALRVHAGIVGRISAAHPCR